MFWETVLFGVCAEMKARGEAARTLPDGIEIRWWPGGFCRACGSAGVYIAVDPSLPAGDETGDIGRGPQTIAQYCDHCGKAGSGLHYRYITREYLPILRAAIRKEGAGGLEPGSEKCPLCGSLTCVFLDWSEDSDSWTMTHWILCPNPPCEWEGSSYCDGGRFGYW